MSFDEQLNRMINEAEVPERLLPENIALMLKEKTAEKETAPRPVISIKSKHRAIAVRSVAALAACAALAVGVFKLSEKTGSSIGTDGEAAKAYGQLTGAADYSDIYKKMTDVIVNSSTVSDGYDEIVNPNPHETGKPAEQIAKANKNPALLLKYGVLSAEAEGVAEADIIKTNGNNLYYTANNALYVISSDGGNMTVMQKIERDGNEPFEMYLADNRLIVLSENITEVPYQTGKPAEETTASEAPESAEVPAPAAEEPEAPVTVEVKQTLAEIYDISGEKPVLLKTYKQSGGYSASRMIGNNLYLVTDHSRYQTKPLSEVGDLDNYIPAYYLDGEKHYVEAGDIYLPENVRSTSYSVIGGLDVSKEQPLVSVKAVLGSGKSVSCSAGNLYLVGSTWDENGADCSAVTKFALEDGAAQYKATAVLNGEISDSFAIDEYNTTLRLALTAENSKGAKECRIVILDASLKLLGEAAVPDGVAEAVVFCKDRAYVMLQDKELPYEISLENPSAPAAVTAANSASAFLIPFNGSSYLGLSSETSEDGAKSMLRLSLFASEPSGLSEKSYVSFGGELSGLISESVIDRSTLLVDAEAGIIGIPAKEKTEYGTRNLYYIFSYDENGLQQKGVMEYSDIDDSGIFNRGTLMGDMLYAFSEGRIVSIRLSDMKVVEALTLD